MKIPSENFTIKIGPLDYDVCYSADIANEGESFGSTHNNEQRIFIDPAKKRQKQEHTFIHELLHAIFFVNGLTYRFGQKDVDRLPSEEDTVRETATLLYQVIKENPHIFND